MISLDRSSSLPVSEQLAEQLRYHVAAGRYRTGERVPSTRELADQLHISFHTVRKAYQLLEAEGLLDSRRGGGFYVADRKPLPATDRRERGATVLQDALQKLVGLGMSEEEMDYLWQEQREFFESPGTRRKLVCAAPYRELAEAAAEQLAGVLQERVEPTTITELVRHADADHVIVPMPSLPEAREAVPNVDVSGVLVGPLHGVLERVARLAPMDTLGLLARHRDALDPLADELRHLTGFSGTVLALPADADRRQIDGLIRQSTLVLFTAAVRRRMRPLLEGATHAEVSFVLAPESLTTVRTILAR